jgi:uncharacterized protein with PQ loop repeat
VAIHAFCTTLGWFAVVVGVVSTVTQYRRATELGIEGISLATWFTFMLLGGFWITYGSHVHSWIIALGSISVLPLQLAVVLRLKPWRRWNVILRCVAFFTCCCVVPTALAGWSVGVTGVGVAMVINRGPQLVELVRHRGATGVSAGAWSLAVVGSSLWILYYVGYRLWAALVATCAAALANLAIALLAAWRHRQGRVDAGRLDVVAARAGASNYAT